MFRVARQRRARCPFVKNVNQNLRTLRFEINGLSEAARCCSHAGCIFPSPTPPYPGARTPTWLLLLPAICAATLILIAAVQPWITLTQAFRDVQAVVYKIENRDLIPLAGFLSNFGIMAWVATFAISGFSALMIRSKRQTVLLGSLSILTLVLALDDFFIIHERVGPKNLGIPEKLFFLTYGLSAIAIVIAFFKRYSRRGRRSVADCLHVLFHQRDGGRFLYSGWCAASVVGRWGQAGGYRLLVRLLQPSCLVQS